MAGRRVLAALEAHALLLLLLTGSALQCGPGRRSGRVRRPKKMTPLVFKQHVPNVSEYTLGASGPAEKRITRDSPEFKDLLENYNSDIVFKDEENTGADRIMSQRCKDKLNTLAIAVMNRWPGVKLRVTEAWDENNNHPRDSLHYEGRAVDISTSDRDRAKNGMLARLAVIAGFDWVYYESKYHIHVSVKSDSSITIKTGGCLAPDGQVRLSSGRPLPVSQVAVGDHVLAMSPDGRLEYSEVYMFLDLAPDQRASFVTIATEAGRRVSLTPSHLVHVTRSAGTPPHLATPTFASRVRAGDYVYVAAPNATWTAARVEWVAARSDVGLYAPLTKHGTLLVDDVLVSCYALIDSPSVAHWSFAPMRLYHNTWTYFRRKWGFDDERLPVGENQTHAQVGVHWYAHALHALGRAVLSDTYWFSL